MSSGVDGAGDVQPAPARGDDEPATSERVSDGSERHLSEGDDWEWGGHSHGTSWWDSGNQWGSWSWNRPWHGGGQERRASWATSRDDYSTEASMRYGDSWNHSDDGHRHGGDRGAHGRDLRPDRADLEGVWQDPWADGRERGLGLRDSPGADRPWEATATGSANPVWSGWRHFAPTGSNYYGDVSEGTSQKNANPRPSEKLSVPVFNGGDEEDVGTSARSYLRQVEAWRRLTYLPPNQQGLVLYRHLAGKAWVAAEELNVDALSRDDGVHYLMSWLRNRYLDLEVTRIGKALSEMFRRLRRKHGQSIRDYNAEYDRLHARLKEVGCMLPEECAAWLYVDRLQLEEGAELNLLASVGNVYSLNKLQKAAIIQDRGLRKPWESGNGKGGRKPFTAHVTDSGDHDEDADFAEEPYDGDEAMPEEVAVAYMTYQSAKNKYKEYAKARGYKGENHDSGGSGQKGNDAAPSAAKTRDEKLRQIKARSFCSGCGRKGHWHKDEECPNNAGNRDNTVGKGGNVPKEVCFTMPAEVMTMKHIAGNLLGITDTACARTVAGTQWLQDYMDRIGDDGAQPELSKECEAYKFGTGRIHYSSFSVVLSFSLGNKVVQLRASIIPGDIPLLLSKTVLGKMGMIYDVSLGCADFTQVGLKGYKLMSTASGHPAIPIVPAKPAGGVKSVLSIEDLSLEPREQYTVHAVAYTGPSTQSLYNLYYEKKLPPEVKVMLSQTQLCRESFFAWWGQCEVGGAQKRFAAVLNVGLKQLLMHGGPASHAPDGQLVMTWSPEEIKSVIMEFREARKDTDATEKMKKISQLTLDELKEKAKELNVEHPSRITKGNLLRLVRDSLNTPDNELMKIGKHRGLEFREIPWQYGQWASNEVKVSKNADPELVRFARWWDQNEERTKDNSYVKESFDETSRRPMPPTSEPGTSTSWETVSHTAWETSWPVQPPLGQSKTGYQDVAQMPIAPGTGSTTNTKRRTQDTKTEAMDDEIDENTAEEIRKLELRLALLKDKAGRDCCGNDFDPDQVITDGDLLRALRTQHSVLGVNPEPNVGDRRDLPPGERLAKAAYDKGDFTYETLKVVLEAADLRPRRNDRGEAFTDNNDHKKHSYFTFGLFTHGGVQGVTKLTVDRPHLCRYLNSFGASKIDSGQTWSSISIGKNIEAGMHRDYNNLKGTANHTCSFGQDSGGQVWLEDKRVSEEDAKKTDYVWRRGAGGAWLPGRLKNTFETVLTFDPHHNHATCPWEGERWSMTFHTTRGILKANRECCNVLRRVGFPLPNLRGVQATPTSRRPKKSTRAAIGNVAGKLSAMMTTLLVAAGSYMSDYLPAVQHDPVVMFEIGGMDATYEAAEMNKAVIEPMTWDDYGIHERRKDAYHFVYGISPKELRVNLQGMPEDAKDPILELIRTQVDGGEAAILRGGDPDYFVGKLKDVLAWSRTDSYGEKWVCFSRQKEGHRRLDDPQRPHQVYVLDENLGEETDKQGLKYDGSGITFEDGVPGIVKSSLRRLHQNLGHPRKEDLVRHLRLAGCEDTIIKAAKGMRCTICAATAGPRISRPSAVPRMYDFNDCVGADLLHHHDIDDKRHTFLSLVDWGTSYHIVIPLEGFDNEDIEKAFNDHWVVPFGPPKTVSLDLDGAVQKGICRLCDWHNIGVKNVAAQAHWQAGITERQGAWWKSIWERVRHELSITEDEVHLAASLVSSAKNELRRRCGHSPTEWVFGRHPRLPEGLADPDNGDKVTWDVTPESRYQRAAAIRTSARIAFHHSQGDSRLRKALLQRARTTARPLEVGETVHFWDQPKNRRRGRWAGPAVIVGREGDSYWISRNGRCRLTASEHLRPSGPEEVGEYLRIKGVQAEVEKLLEVDLDADETYDGDLFPEDEEMPFAVDDQADDVDNMSEYVPSEPGEDLEPEAPRVSPPLRRLKRKTRPPDSTDEGRDINEFKEAEETQWKEHLSFDALEPLSVSESIEASAGDIRCAFLTGGYLKRDEELFLHQPSTGFAGLHPEQLVKVKKNIFGLATSPHEWWLDLQRGIKAITVVTNGEEHAFDQCALDPCVFLLRRRDGERFVGRPLAYVGSHVDDLLVIAPTSIGNVVEKKLSDTFPVDTWEDDEFAYLGSEIVCRGDSVLFRQKPYIENRLFTVDIPRNVNEDDLAGPEQIADNRSLVGALSWVSAQSRPDLTCSVSMAQQLQKSPTYGDVKFTNGISQKAKEYKENGLTFHKVDDENAVILVYHDAAWANAYEGEYDEEGFELYEEDKASGLQHHGPPSHREGRKAKRGNSRVASQLGELVILSEKFAIAGGSSRGSILDWKSRAGQRVCRSTFSAETQACVEGLEGGQYVRAVYEAITYGDLKRVEDAMLPIVCLSDCRSLYDHLHREGVPRTPADRRLAIDLAALRQALRLERWTQRLPLAWIPSEMQLGDILTKPQDPKGWWHLATQKLTIPISIIEKGGLSNKVFREEEKTSVKPCVKSSVPSPYLFRNHPHSY
ncbi:Copia protein [Symbiodinium microadriaticum]|uniref:Copia protein n=1 Tax=Symbiodinium microadriaticum TaxID=2951 RepID=A0A1Q9D6S2_SYMMI|nr:Copia protein [Symbiodinium microadriaticum]CAE7528745.1 RE1 [Symbiodinium microadriaticum]CAE7939147.1 RE1 [Symbiodinium sp. KB8]